MINDTAKQFMQFAIDNQVLSFGEFELKSGRISPYFYNSGLFETGHQIARLGEFYAQAIVDSGIEFDVLFGPAYKGIPLVCTVAIALAEKHGIDKPFCFNRKEAKDHGEGGDTVGAELTGRVLVIDDVISAGTAFRESVRIVGQHETDIVGFVISFDRQERGQGILSAVQEIEQNFSIPIVPIAKLDDLLDIMRQTGMKGETLIEDYQRRYGI